MKNGKLVTEWLNYCEQTITLIRTPTIEAQEEVHARLVSGRDTDLWQALLADGWTVAELDVIYERRTGFRAPR